MAQQDDKPKRSWQEIAEEACLEKDSRRLLELIEELKHALDEQDRKSVEPDTGKQRGTAA